jgi:D-alanyl-lipoteichoic acid acyltransferase DltB (MBOAT superfamily)
MTSYSPPAAGVDGASASAAGAPPTTRRDALRPLTRSQVRELTRFGIVFGQLALVVAVVRVFDIENAAFQNVMTLVLGAFAVHHFLPRAARLPFFAAVSLLSLVVALDVKSAAWIVGLGALLLGVCHLPVAFGRRVALLCGVAVLLAALRTWGVRHLDDVVPPAIWPILGSMFMFRLIVYLYELRHRGAPFGFWRAAAYFFMVPNVCFPLFPVVDYRTFCRGREDDDVYPVYAVGLGWMLRGVVQLLIYRFVYQNFLIEPSAAASLRDVGQYMLATFLLYLKVSGTFHLIVGTLRMFGFGLPETHHRYLLASGFTDFWRRINIYWKDFIQNIVFYPLFFRLRGLGRRTATILATLLAFVVTWLLHSYQWFWIRGTFPITWTDAAFWLTLGAAVVAGVALETRPGRSPGTRAANGSLRSKVGLALRTAGTFVAICALWTVWSTPSTVELRELLGAARNVPAGDVLLVLLVPVMVGVAAVLVERKPRPRPEPTSTPGAQQLLLSGLLPTAACLLLIAVGSDAAWARLGIAAPAEVTALQRNKLNEWDLKTLERGYYEDLGDPGRFNNGLDELYQGRPAGWRINPASRVRHDLLAWDLAPSTNGSYKGAALTTNSMGMRDREYALHKPAGTLRVALIGSSHEVGAGVGDDQTYENIVEDRLNRELSPPAGQRYEILNFAVPGYAALQKLAILEQRAFAFEPDVVLYVVHSYEFDWVGLRLAPIVARGDDIPYEFVRQVVEKARVAKGDPPELIAARLSPYAHEVVRWAFERLAEDCRTRGAKAIVVLLEKPEELGNRALDDMRRMASDVGLEVIDLRGAYAGVRSRKSLWIAKWDNHPNAEGHRLLAERLYHELLGSRALRHQLGVTDARVSR